MSSVKSLIAQDKLFDTLFLLFLGTLGGFIGGGVTACQIQKLVRDNIYVKQFLFFIIIYFTNSFVQKSSSLWRTFSTSIILYIIFVMLMKNNYKSIMIVFGILFINKLLLQYKNQLLKDTKNTPTIKMIDNIRYYLTLFAAVVMILGFGQYYMEKKGEYKKQFNNITFIFGSNKCKSLL